MPAKVNETIYETYTRTVCSICENKKDCQETLRIRIDNTIRCDNYKTKLKKKRVQPQYWGKW